ncbi:hypothetical protein A3Q56_06716 [Intoshia linei]|uniref:RUN domain-containing protein n=1 Tax=Intoshia linei TaxID=1819745 RepID=A0A177AVX4_9BILA|nr:hypothetical protein A3Q56_06716 [Intoshia linei]
MNILNKIFTEKSDEVEISIIKSSLVKKELKEELDGISLALKQWDPTFKKVIKCGILVDRICKVLEAIFIHQLKYDKKQVYFINVIKNYSPPGIIKELKFLSQIKSTIGVCRSWIRYIVNDYGTLHGLVLSLESLDIRHYYFKNAFLRDKDCFTALTVLITCFENHHFSLSVNCIFYNDMPSSTLLMAGRVIKPAKDLDLLCIEIISDVESLDETDVIESKSNDVEAVPIVLEQIGVNKPKEIFFHTVPSRLEALSIEREIWVNSMRNTENYRGMKTMQFGEEVIDIIGPGSIEIKKIRDRGILNVMRHVDKRKLEEENLNKNTVQLSKIVEIEESIDSDATDSQNQNNTEECESACDGFIFYPQKTLAQMMSEYYQNLPKSLSTIERLSKSNKKKIEFELIIEGLKEMHNDPFKVYLRNEYREMMQIGEVFEVCDSIVSNDVLNIQRSCLSEEATLINDGDSCNQTLNFSTDFSLNCSDMQTSISDDITKVNKENLSYRQIDEIYRSEFKEMKHMEDQSIKEKFLNHIREVIDMPRSFDSDYVLSSLTSQSEGESNLNSEKEKFYDKILKKKKMIHIISFNLKMEISCSMELVDNFLKIVHQKNLFQENFKCSKCSEIIGFTEKKFCLCKYDGRLYCKECHSGKMSIIPSQILHNFNFDTFEVCNECERYINYSSKLLIINIDKRNPLFNFDCMVSAKKQRRRLKYIWNYLDNCKFVSSQDMRKCLINSLKAKNGYMFETEKYWRIEDLVKTKNGAFTAYIEKALKIGIKHIESCYLCIQRGHICQICFSNDVLFPFYENINLCSNGHVTHTKCFLKENYCRKCKIK